MNNNNTNYNKKEDVTKVIDEAMFEKKLATMQDIKELTPELEILDEIRYKVKEALYNRKPVPKFNNLYQLISSINLMKISHKKLSKNKGTSTEGSEKKSVEKFSLNDMKKLSKKILDKTFKWKITKQVRIPRPNKKPRPLGIPNYSEKIIQNNILMILESIYEPIFENLNVSYGFRPHKGCMDALDEISHYKNQGLNWIIEGDIKRAFDNVHPPKLANLLKNNIEDKDFINIIYEACTNPIIFKFTRLESPEGTPQGSIISPILFNIYMHHFDIELINLLKNYKDTIHPELKYSKPTKEYKQRSFKIETLRKRIKIIQSINKIRKLKKEEKIIISIYKKKIRTLIKTREKSNSINYQNTPFRYFYNRYADDFIIMINISIELCKKIIEQISEILKTKYYLELSIEKTKITNLKIAKAKYLGYTLFMQNRPSVTSRKTGHVTRSGRQILIGIDTNRTYKKLIENNYANKDTLKPIACKSIIKNLTDQEIIEKYNQLMAGLYNYYYPIITYKSELTRIQYILFYSAVKTLARKHDKTSRKIFQEYGYDEHNSKNIPTNRKRIVVSYEIQNTKQEFITKFITLINYRDSKDMAINVTNNRNLRKELIKKSKNIKFKDLTLKEMFRIQDTPIEQRPDIPTEKQIEFEDIWTKYKINWRTSFKIEKFCNICGSTENLETHHIKHIKANKKDKFTSTIMRQLNRKQLVVCKICHNKIHNGTYNGLPLKQLYDQRLSQIESYLKTETTSYYKETIKITNKTKINYEHFPINKIIINHRPLSQLIAEKPNKYD